MTTPSYGNDDGWPRRDSADPYTGSAPHAEGEPYGAGDAFAAPDPYDPYAQGAPDAAPDGYAAGGPYARRDQREGFDPFVRREPQARRDPLAGRHPLAGPDRDAAGDPFAERGPFARSGPSAQGGPQAGPGGFADDGAFGQRDAYGVGDPFAEPGPAAGAAQGDPHAGADAYAASDAYERDGLYGQPPGYPQADALATSDPVPAAAHPVAETATATAQRPAEAKEGKEGKEGKGAREGEGAAAPSWAGGKKPGRDRYLDLLRSLALVRVVAYHVFGWAWLTILFPSMGVMFALAGSLMARSLNRPALGVIRGRIRRLLPPVWVFGAVAVPLMFLSGWQPAKQLGGTWLIELFTYVVPFGAPPYPWNTDVVPGVGWLSGSWAVQAAGPLWYIRAYLWFVIASPLLLWAFRRVPWATLLAPLALTAVVGTGLVEIPGETGRAITDFAVYGSCWVVGFAHQDGLLKQVPRYLAVSCAALFMGFGLWWASGHLGPDGWDLNDIPLAQAAWSFGFVVILLQYAPSWQELPGRLAQFDKLITLSNNRAVTIYLWHNALIMATIPLLDPLWQFPIVYDTFGTAFAETYSVWMFVLVWPLIGLTIVAVGWIEDLAAGRKPRLWPDGSRRARAGGTRRR